MLDTTTYLLTQNNPAGPILRPAEPMAHELFDNSDDDLGEPSRGRVIGGLISLVLLVGTGAYFYLTL
jgi:hypothetical protein